MDITKTKFESPPKSLDCSNCMSQHLFVKPPLN